MPARVTRDASNMLSNNLVSFIDHFWNKEENTFEYTDDEILKGCLVTKDGVLVNERVGE